MNDFLNELNDIFEEVKDKEVEFEQLPDGEYLTIIEDLVQKESKNGKPGVLFTLEIIHGEYEGRKIWKWLNLTGKDEKQLRRNLNTYAVQMRQIGISTDAGLEGTFDQFDNIIGADIVATIKTKKGYTNITLDLA